MTEAGAFDATGYRQRVLSKLRGAATLDLSDPFFIVDLPVDVDDDESDPGAHLGAGRILE